VYRSEVVVILPLKVLRTSTTNDRLRQILLGMAKEVIDDMDDIVKYMRIKGWNNMAPLYPNIPPSVTEKLDAGEAFHLWDHLTFRYDNIHQTTIYYGYAVDPDFKAFLYTGIRELLLSQAEVLERECLHFGIPLPKRPPKVVATQAPNEAVPDDYMYRQISMGITGAVLMHAMALKQCLTNDRVRSLFKELLLSEIDLQNMLIKYGKLKGWLNYPPNYKLGIS
jgi:spore coat protein CotF